MSGRLIKEYEDYAEDDFSDFLLLIATGIEDSLIQAGAEPGKDYSYLDIYKLAVEVWKDRGPKPDRVFEVWPPTKE